MTSHDGDDRRCADCLLCQAAGAGGLAGSSPGGVKVTHADDEVIALVDPDIPGVLVAPRAHVDTLATDPTGAGTVLGALRRVAAAVEASYGASGAAIEPTTDLLGAAGHVCYRVVPTVGGVPLPPGTGPGIDAHDLAAALRNTVAERDALPPA